MKERVKKRARERVREEKRNQGLLSKKKTQTTNN